MANTELTPDFCLALGMAASRVLGPGPFLIGRDTRLSGPLLQAALSAGIASAGFDVVDVGVLPTPAIAWASAEHGLPAAIVSASHNPFQDNGIKFFQSGGLKLTDEIERSIESNLATALRPVVDGDSVGDIKINESLIGDYSTGLIERFDSLANFKVVIDCANGATTVTAPDVISALGADVRVLFDRPDGRNINAGCGSTYPEALMRAVVEENAQMGLAFDGDGDRVLAVDETGSLVDGDHILGMLAIEAKRRGTLNDDTLVVTVMSNLGLRIAMSRAGITLHETAVGDRHVLDALDSHGWNLGGEQSGHVILRDSSTTGDGLLAGLHLMSLVFGRDEPLSRIATETMTRLPQVLRNVAVRSREALAHADDVWSAVEAAEFKLGESGRVLLRPSGTEQLIRVMVEAVTLEQAEAVCDRLCRIVERELSG